MSCCLLPGCALVLLEEEEGEGETSRPAKSVCIP